MVLSYRVAKQDYDYAHSAVMQLEAAGSQGGPKLEAAQKKLQVASDKYEQIKSEVCFGLCFVSLNLGNNISGAIANYNSGAFSQTVGRESLYLPRVF